MLHVAMDAGMNTPMDASCNRSCCVVAFVAESQQPYLLPIPLQHCCAFNVVAKGLWVSCCPYPFQHCYAFNAVVKGLWPSCCLCSAVQLCHSGRGILLLQQPNVRCASVLYLISHSLFFPSLFFENARPGLLPRSHLWPSP